MRDLFRRPTDARHQADIVRQDRKSAQLDIATLDPLLTRRILPRPNTVPPPTQVVRGQLRKVPECIPIRTSLERRTERTDRQASLRKIEREFQEPPDTAPTKRPRTYCTKHQ